MPGKTYVETRTFEETIRKIQRDITNLKQGISPGTPAPTGEPVIAPGIVAQYWRGDKTWQTLNQAAVAGLTTGDSPAWISVRIADSNASHHLALVWNEDRTADQTLNLITGAANRTITLIGDPTLSDWFDQAVKVVSRPTHQEMFLGPEGSEAATRLVFKSYFDFGTSGSAERVAGHITGEGTGEPSGGTTDVPGTRGTEWNLDTHEFISPTGLTTCESTGTIFGTLIIIPNDTSGTVCGYSTITGAKILETAAHNCSVVRGICNDGTHFYIAGIKAAGNVRSVLKYKISDFSHVADWDSTWPEWQGVKGLVHSGGFLYAWDFTQRIMFKINASTMVSLGSANGPEYTPGSRFQIYSFVVDSAGAYLYAIAMDATDPYAIKFNVSNYALVQQSALDPDWTNTCPIFHYAEGGTERIYYASTQGGTYGAKMNMATLAPYYDRLQLAHEAYGVLADDTYLYAIFASAGVDRYLKNSIGGTASTEAGVLRFWVNKLGVITEGASLDDDLNFTAKGAFISEIATGTAPVQPASVTMCPNLNADMIDGVHGTDIAPSAAKYIVQELHASLSAEQSLGALTTGILKNTVTGAVGVLSIAAGADLPAHTHAYEPALGNPGTTGWILSSTDAGVRTWIAPGGAGAIALDDLTDVDAATPANGDVLTWNEAGSAWVPETPAAGGGLTPFVDNFDDASIFADWVQYGTSGSVRTIVEADGHLKFDASSGQYCDGSIPRAFLPIPFFPCEIETKVVAYNKGERTKIGMMIGPDGQGWASVNNCYIEHIYSSGDGLDNITVEDAASNLFTVSSSTIPCWFKIRCMGAHKGAQWLFYYSTDGSTWTLAYTRLNPSAAGGLCCGLYIGNWYNAPAVNGEFEYFTITPYTFEGPG